MWSSISARGGGRRTLVFARHAFHPKPTPRAPDGCAHLPDTLKHHRDDFCACGRRNEVVPGGAAMGVRESPRCPSFRDPANLHHAPPVFQPVALASVDMIRTLFRGPALPLTKMGANPAKKHPDRVGQDQSLARMQGWGWARRRHDAFAGTTHRASCGKHKETAPGVKLAELTEISRWEDEKRPWSFLLAHAPSPSCLL